MRILDYKRPPRFRAPRWKIFLNFENFGNRRANGAALLEPIANACYNWEEFSKDAGGTAIMSIERARAHLKKYNLDGRIRELELSSATVELAAKALNVEGARIAKTLSYLVDDQAILVVAAGDVRVDNRKFKDAFHTKAKMLTPEQAAELVGHAVGGVCPFGVNPGVKVYLDESLRRFETVFPAAGSSNSAIELTIPELETASNYTAWVDLRRTVSADN